MCLPKNLKGATIQRIVTIFGNILCLNFGMMFGITPAHMKLYMKEETPLNRVANNARATWIFGYLFVSAAVGALVCGLIRQKIGRRTILLLSGLLQIFEKRAYTICNCLLLLHIFFASMGLYPLISLIPTEMLPAKLYLSLTSFSWALSWLIIFILVQYFQYFSSLIGLHGILIVFGVSCGCVALFALLVLPETRGKSLEEIQKLMGFKNGANIAQSKVPQDGRIPEEEI